MNVLGIMDKQKVVVLWLKRDLRITDHKPAAMAIAHGLPVICLYVYEPYLLEHPDSDIRHWRFAHQSILQLNQYLHNFHQRVIECYGNMLSVLDHIQLHFSIEAIYSHEEIGVGVSFDRDKALAKWCNQHIVRWIECPTNGIIRGLKSRKNWQNNWYNTMQSAIINPDWEKILPTPISEIDFTSFELPPLFKAAVSKQVPLFQPGGYLNAHEVLQSFLQNRIWQYSSSISKPHESREGCSRLSAHLAWGNLSIREVYQAAVYAAAQYPPKSKQIQFFITRLFWHCHFIQKFESYCSMEFENVNKGYDLIRNERNELFIEAWRNGQTGYPLVDASMECLRQTGYINFRMRAMLVSFFTHNLWQHLYF
jgi:deoxyribodipyrimidine photo-lyase